ncbi:hypothetical protein BX600DRAFT_510618 [Xylariales sp. PMI_506]|nr:hypothetical protein BX600DRAFT_510618 [Xylariales sp. PMI_506]
MAAESAPSTFAHLDQFPRRSMRIVIRESIDTARKHYAANIAEEDVGRDLKPVIDTATTAAPTQEVVSSGDVEELGSRRATTRESKSLRPRQKQQQQQQHPHLNGIPAEQSGWYYITSIVNEAGTGDRLRYLVKWDGINPLTGLPFPDSWVSPEDVSAAALESWEQDKMSCTQFLQN